MFLASFFHPFLFLFISFLLFSPSSFPCFLHSFSPSQCFSFFFLHLMFPYIFSPSPFLRFLFLVLTHLSFLSFVVDLILLFFLLLYPFFSPSPSLRISFLFLNILLFSLMILISLFSSSFFTLFSSSPPYLFFAQTNSKISVVNFLKTKWSL